MSEFSFLSSSSMAVTITCLQLVAKLQWSKCWEHTCAYFFDRPELLSNLTLTSVCLLPLTTFMLCSHSLKKKKKMLKFLFLTLINDMFTSAPSPKSNNYRINVFFNSPQYQKQRCATCKSKQENISGDYKANEKRLEIAELGSFSTIWPYFPCPRNSCKHGHFHLKN